MLKRIETFLMYPAPPASAADWYPDWLRFEEARIATDDGIRLHAWLLEHPAAKAVTMYFHGNGTHLGYLAEELDEYRQRLQMTVFAFDYHGYGQTPGKPDEKNILGDAATAFRWLCQRLEVDASEIVLWGRSLGGAVATYLAMRTRPRLLVLDRTFNSMVDVASYHYPWLPVRRFLHNRYPADSWIAQYRGPLIQIHGRDDEVVPLRLGRKLFEACPGTDKQFVELESLTHNAPLPEEVYQVIERRLSGADG